MANKSTIGSDILCTQSKCVKINVHATIEWALFHFTILVLISFQHINSFTHANIHLASSNGYGYFNTVVFGYYYLSLNTNTCALLLVCCGECGVLVGNEVHFILKMKNNLAPDYKRHLPESNMNNQKSSLSPSDHIIYTRTNIGSSHSNHILFSYRLFLGQIKLTIATIERKTFLPFLFWFKCFRKGLCRMDVCVCVQSSKHSTQTNGQCRWFVINMKCVRCGPI